MNDTFLNFLRTISCRLRTLRQRRVVKREIDEELRFHLELRTAENLAAGMSPEEAARAARKRFGNVQSVREQCRESRGASFGETTVQDVRFGLRMLWKNPAFTVVAILTLALGIGATTAIFSLANAVLFRPLPFRDPGSLVWITNPDRSGAGIPGMNRSVNVRDWRERNQSFEDLGCYVAWFGRQQTILNFKGELTRMEGAWVDQEFLKVLGISPSLGRDFMDEDGYDAVILTDRFWKQQFQADSRVLGSSITINGRPWAVVGILPPEFDFTSVFTPGSPVDFLRPAPVFGAQSDNTQAVIGRLKPGTTLQQAQSEFDGLNQQLRGSYPERGTFEARLIPLREHISGQFRFPFLILACAVGCVLLITCVNLANLLLARAASRRKEIAVRIALGASRWRLIRQTLTESLLLAGGGGVLGIPLAHLVTAAFAQSHAFDIPLLRSARVDGLALGYALVTACCTGILFGIVPALQFSSERTHHDLKEAGRGTSAGKRGLWIRETLVVAEVALTCVLLVGAGLLSRSFVRLLDVNLGFRPEQVAACRVRTDREFTTNTQEVAYFEDLSQRIQALPGVESVGFTHGLPFALRDVVKVRVQGESYGPGETPSVFVQGGDQGYFKTLRIPLLAGRLFDAHDAVFDVSHISDAPTRVLVNQKMARSLWHGRDAVDQMVLMQMNGNTESDAFKCKVIGVVGDVRQSPLELEAAPQLYFPETGGQLVVRTKQSLSSLAPAVRTSLREFGSDLILGDFKTLGETLDQTVSPKRLILLLVGFFSLLALILASVGIYGVMAYSMSQRTQEIGIRLALGSSKSQVLRLILGRGMRLAFIGCLIGLAASLGLTRIIQSLLFAVSPTDPLTYVASGCLLLGVALLACGLPGHKATRVDPMIALRQE